MAKHYGAKDWSAAAFLGLTIAALGIWLSDDSGSSEKMSADESYAWVMAGNFVERD